MQKVNRRTLMAAGTTIAASGLFGSTAAAQDGDGEEGEGNGENGGSEGNADFPRPDEVAWRYDGPYNIGSATVEGDRLYTQSDGAVYAIDTADGSLVWETGDIEARRTPVVKDDTVYVPGERVHALDAETGETQWESDVGRFTMAVGHGMVYTSDEGTVYALDNEDGSVVWERGEVTIERQISGETEEVSFRSLSVGDTDEDWVYVFDDDAWGREVVGLNPMTGETGVVVGPMDGVAGVMASSGYLGVQPPYDSTFLIDVSTSENLGGIHQSVGQAFSGDGYFTANLRGNLLAYDLSAGGELAWEMEYAQSYPEVAGNTAVVLYGPSSVQHTPEESEDEDRIVAYDLQTGDEQWRYVFDEREWSTGDGPTEGIEIDENTVYISRDGELLALRPDVEEDEEPEDEEPEEEEPEDDESEEEEPGDDESEDADPEEDEPGDDESGEEESEGETSEDDSDDTDDPTDDESEDDDEPVDDFAAGNLDLSVRSPDSISRGESACFEIIVRNEWDETAEVSITLDIAATGDEAFAEIEPGDTYASFHTVHCSELSAGENEWFITAGGESESGTLVLE